ncbi:MAG: acyl-[acyl-carrier-protein]--UDP-N-acetylglucosamine O-acyltransferase [bacterium TMED198]|nr:MAG: acyl-[acyl-carrier-protein]--UDP-N-acetylglucosamine O-acyltransferase [bacterium TMED198]
MKNNRLISDASSIGKNTEIGAFSIIEENVTIGDNCTIANNVLIKKNTVIGNNCEIHTGAIIGDDPQDIKFSKSIKSKVKIGNNNIIREYCTIHRSTEENSITMIGDNCYLMAYVHIAHDCNIGNNVILANAVQAAGFVAIHDNAVVGGLTPIHQFCKIGKFSFIGGGLRIVQDVPPYILANGEPLQFSGLNSIGLRRNNFSSRSINEIKKAYKLIYKSEFNISQSVRKIKSEFETSGEIDDIINFIENSKRGLI